MVQSINEEIICPYCNNKHLFQGRECLNEYYFCPNKNQGIKNQNLPFHIEECTKLHFPGNTKFHFENGRTWINTKIASEYLNYSQNKIRYRLEKGIISGYKSEETKRRWKVDAISVILYHEEQRHYYSPTKVSEKMGISKTQLIKKIKSGEILGKKIRNRWVCIDI